MGQFLSVYDMDGIAPGRMICGLGADVIFRFPLMRQIMASLGTQPAKRASIAKIFKSGYDCAVIPGGIAEMFTVSEDAETVYFRTRQNTVKAAIEEGAHIVPTFFFGNSKIFKVPRSDGLNDSWLAKFSRKFRASIILFYGRHGLPFCPFRHPLHIVSGDVVKVKQSDSPTAEEIADVQQRVIASIEKVYKEKKPDWETRPLVIL